jgi:hypothetical protein
MKQVSTNDFKAASIFTGQCYGTKVTIELDHSDLDISELFEAFKGVALGLGFSENSWNEYIRETGYELQLDLEQSEINLPHSNEHWNHEDSTFDWSGAHLTTALHNKDLQYLNHKDAAIFAESIINPPEPNEALKNAAEKYNNEVTDDGIQ